MLARAQELGIEVKTASSGLDEDAAALVRLSYDDDRRRALGDAESRTRTRSRGRCRGRTCESDTESDLDAEPGPEVEPEPDGGESESDDEHVLLVEPGLTTHELARLIQTRTVLIVQALMEMGEMVPAGGEIPIDAIEPLGRKFGYELLVAEQDEVELVDEGPSHSVVEYEDDPASLKPRPAVVTVMGHVDHGKTQLLDTIRTADVVAGEAGGITQHIGAYQVTSGGNLISFIDTPGHEAFTALRARGANVTDLVILVVAANDGVMPQTVEAIDHAKAADVPIIVAINKMDLETADPYAVRAALTQHGIVVEDLGGDVPAVEVSALKGDGIDDLLEIVALVAEVEELTANPNAPAVGTVIEGQLEVGRGPVATVIVQRGTLKKGDAIVCGTVSGRVRAMFDERGGQAEVCRSECSGAHLGMERRPACRRHVPGRAERTHGTQDGGRGDGEETWQGAHGSNRHGAADAAPRDAQDFRSRRAADHRESRRTRFARGDPRCRRARSREMTPRSRLCTAPSVGSLPTT